MFKGAN